MSRLIIISNRLPIQFREKNGTRSLSTSSGGLVSSIISYLEHSSSATNLRAKKPVWIGSPDLAEKKFNQFISNLSTESEAFELQPVFLPESVKNNFYQGFCNDCIWPLFHYFPSYARYNPDYFAAYTKANEFFLNKVAEVYQPGDIIWIHDYHLMLLPEMIRKKIPGASIGFFLHIPFPSFELFRIMPGDWKKQILNGLLGADLIGFHTNDYMQYFLKSVRHVLGYDTSGRKIQTPDRVVAADAVPVSIDFHKFYSAANSSAVFDEKNSIRKKMSGRQIIISVDRLDYSKALINRLEAFDLFLNKNHSYHGKVSYILLIVPSREIITKYKENKQEIERLISNINGKYGDIDWTPVLYQYKSLDFTKLAGLYFSADVALITPIRDGMNLVAKEFVSTRVDKRGVLILSETAGAAAELKEAVVVNPSDRQEIANAILTALTMPVEEQIIRNESMQNRIRNYDVVKWADDFISELTLQKTLQQVMVIKELNTQIEKVILQNYQQANKRLILLDYDGTLSPFARLPHLAAPSPQVIELLQNLCSDTSNKIVLISGRTRESIGNWFSQLSIGLIAEHGGFIKLPNTSWQQSVERQTEWKNKVLPLFNFYQTRCAGTFIEEKALSIAWHYRNADLELAVIRAMELINDLNELSSQFDFQVLQGNMVIEARVKGVDKGTATKKLMEKTDYDFILAIGDDKTDEDMFRVLPESAYSIRVGLTQSHAKYNLKNQGAVIEFLNKLVQTPTLA